EHRTGKLLGELGLFVRKQEALSPCAFGRCRRAHDVLGSRFPRALAKSAHRRYDDVLGISRRQREDEIRLATRGELDAAAKREYRIEHAAGRAGERTLRSQRGGTRKAATAAQKHAAIGLELELAVA